LRRSNRCVKPAAEMFCFAPKADIVLHHVPTAGGASFDGYAICSAKDCPPLVYGSFFQVSFLLIGLGRRLNLKSCQR
jgi:hypothetical protein